jgi:hypothetical protein
MNRKVSVGQVGIRCKHCSSASTTLNAVVSNEEWELGRGGIYFPRSLDVLYQTAQNMAQQHFCGSMPCVALPERLRQQLSDLKRDKRRAIGGKEYWRQTAQMMGIYETAEHGLRFNPSLVHPSVQLSSSSLS